MYGMMKNAPSWWSIHNSVYRYQERELFFVIYIQAVESLQQDAKSYRLTLSLCPVKNRIIASFEPGGAFDLSKWQH